MKERDSFQNTGCDKQGMLLIAAIVAFIVLGGLCVDSIRGPNKQTYEEEQWNKELREADDPMGPAPYP